MTVLLRADSIEKSFTIEGRHIEVLKGLSLNIEAGERVAIVGSSGAGKSTLLHLLGALDLPSAGEIYFQGQPLSSKNQDELAQFRNKHLGFIFQFHHLLKELTALENVMMPALIARDSYFEAKKKASLLLERVGLSHRLEHRPSELSGGEQQRVSLARALINQPPLLLADEPTGNLDGQTSSEIHELLQWVNKEHGTALIIVTHSDELAQSMPRRLKMIDGRIDQDDKEVVCSSTSSTPLVTEKDSKNA